MANKSNPNGANQYQLDPRQLKCWEFYIDPTSQTFGNATQSAIKAGYEPDYADQITTVDWFKGKVRRLNMLSKAERVLDETLDYIAVNQEGKVDAAVGRLKLDAAKVVATTLGKDEGYSTKVVVDVNNITDLPDEELINLTRTG
jgi:hypothetical protein